MRRLVFKSRSEGNFVSENIIGFAPGRRSENFHLRKTNTCLWNRVEVYLIAEGTGEKFWTRLSFLNHPRFQLIDG